MDLTQIFIAALSIACGVLGWFARELYAATQALRKDLSTLEVRIGTDYVRYDRLQDALKPLVEAIKEIKEHLSNRIER
jgi:cell division protein FtsB